MKKSIESVDPYDGHTRPAYTLSCEQTIGCYRRVVRASLERVWENVLDWEHLPWLHSESFESIALERADRDGWRASVTLKGGGAADIEVVLDRARLRYVTRTLAGAGAGAEIETRLEPRGDAATGIEVDFRIPGVKSADESAVLGFYQQLYARLWDEDESMMRRREGYLAARQGSARVERTRRAVVDGVAVEFAVDCPHLGGPLDDAPIEGGCVTCPWHGYRFDLRTGRCVRGGSVRLKVAVGA